MDFRRLNPQLRGALLYERVKRSDECRAYDCRLIYMVSGDLSIEAGGKRLSHIGPGGLVFIPAGTPYRLKSKCLRAAVLSFDLTDSYNEAAPLPVASADFDEQLCHTDSDSSPFDRVIFIENMESERDTLLRMCNVFTSGEGEYLAELSAMLKLLLLKVAEVTSDNALPARMVEELDTYIRENVGDEISNTEIGAIFGYHPFYVSRVIKEKKGQTLRQYIISYRLKLARRMLELTDRSTSEVAEACGFTDASYFAKTFKTVFGITPKEYRNGFKEDFI